MSALITFTIDGKSFSTSSPKTIIAAAKENGIFIPALCDYKGFAPAATCRICTVLVQGRPVTACTATVTNGMIIENDTTELTNYRIAILEMLFAEGNHFCPSCEKSGFCELQALAYRYRMIVPRYGFTFPNKPVDTSAPKVLLEKNRCILCKRCIRAVKTPEGKNIFAFKERGAKTEIAIDPVHGKSLTDSQAKLAMEICPVGTILVKEKGFATPIGKRPYDNQPIGSEKESGATTIQSIPER